MSFTAEEILKQEQDRELDYFSSKDAEWLGLKIAALAGEQQSRITIAIRRNGQLLFYWAGEEATKEQESWIRRKSNAVELHGHSSLYLWYANNRDEESYYTGRALDRRETAIHGGSFPIRLRKTGIIGTVTVSGLTSEEDHALCAEGLRALQQRIANEEKESVD